MASKVGMRGAVVRATRGTTRRLCDTSGQYNAGDIRRKMAGADEEWDDTPRTPILPPKQGVQVVRLRSLELVRVLVDLERREQW